MHPFETRSIAAAKGHLPPVSEAANNASNRTIAVLDELITTALDPNVKLTES